MTVARNAPCPCGSGKKYKRCHMSEDEPETAGNRSRVALFVVVIGLVAAGIVAATVDLRTGGLVAVGALVAAGAIVSFGDPPPPKQGGDHPASMNFGR